MLPGLLAGRGPAGGDAFHPLPEEAPRGVLLPAGPGGHGEDGAEMRRIVASIPEGETVRQRLQALGAKQSLTDLGVPEEKLPELLRISPLIRNRLTLMRTRRMLDL